MKKVLYLLLLLLSSSRLPAQVDTIDHKKEIVRVKQEQKAEYNLWYPCILISRKDTVKGRIKPKQEYSKIGKFTVTLNNEKELKLWPKDISQLWILNARDTIHYLSLNVEDQLGARLYRVVVDGPCKVLYNIQLNFAGDGFFPIIGTPTLPYLDAINTYYKGELWAIKPALIRGSKSLPSDQDIYFKRVCKNVFTECPTLLEKILSEGYRQENITEIVKEFNQCLASRPPSTKRK